MNVTTLRMFLLGGALATLLAGCDYTLPLAEKPELPIDAALSGLWAAEADRDAAELLVLPLSTNEYMVAYPAGAPNTLYARVCLCKATEFALVQITWFGTGRGVTPTDAHLYQYAAYSVNGDKLTVRLLNPEVVKPMDTAAAMQAAIDANRANPELFRKALAFTRVKPPVDPNAPPVRPPMPAAWR